MKPRDAFATIARSWGRFYRSKIDIAVAVQDNEQWHLLYRLTIFSPQSVQPGFQPLDIATQSLRAVRVVQRLDAKTAVEAVEEQLNNPLTFKQGGWSAAPRSPSGALTVFEYEPLHPARMPGPQRLPSIIVTRKPSPMKPLPPSLLQKVDQELLTHSLPYDGLRELLAELRVPFEATELAEKPVVEIILSPPAWLSIDPTADLPGSQIKEGRLSLTISKHPDLDPTKLRVGLKTHRLDAQVAERRTVSCADLHWEVRDDLEHAQFAVETPNTVLALAILSYEGELLGRWWLRDPALSFNRDLQLHRVLDVSDSFKATFFEDKNDFEDRVTLLLTLLGLRPFKYGAIAHLRDAPDILALSPEGHLYVIDCTTGDINAKGKLHRLHERTKAISAKLREGTDPPVAVLPVMFTSLTRAETAPHWSTAAAYGIALVCREEIEGLLGQLEVRPTPAALYNAALASIPSGQPEAPATK